MAVRRRIITENIEEKFLSTSLAMETLSNNATRLIGPLITGFLYISIGLEGLFLILFVLYLNALILIIFFQSNSKISKLMLLRIFPFILNLQILLIILKKQLSMDLKKQNTKVTFNCYFNF